MDARADRGGLSGRREERDRLSALLRAHAKLCVAGPVGIGKTALVRDVVEREHRRGAIAAPAWVSLDGADDERAIAERTAGAMGWPRASGDEDAAEALRALLASSPRTLVWDDAHGADGGALDRLLDALDPVGTARVIVVSRRALERASLPLFVVPPLSPEDTAELVDRLERERGATLRDALVRHSGGNPLAVRRAFGTPALLFGDAAGAAAASWEALATSAERALADAPDDAEALASTCRARVELGDVEGALARLERHSLARRSMSTQTLRALAHAILAADGRLATRVRLVLSSEQLRRGDVEAALRELDEAAPGASSPESERSLRVFRARVLARSRGLARAHDELERAAESAGAGDDDAPVQLAFVMIALLRGELEASRRSLRELASRTRAAPALECQRALAWAVSYFVEERFERAAAWARRARQVQGRVGVRPTLAGAIEVLALLQLDRVGRAIALIDRNVDDLDVGDAEEPLAAEMAPLYAAAVRARRGDLQGCLQLVEGPLDGLARRGDELTRAFLARYMARAALDLGQLDRAERLLDTARGIAGEGGFGAISPLLDRDAALVAEARGDDDAARERVRAALAARPGSPFVRIEAWAMGATQDAVPRFGRSVAGYASLRAAERALSQGAPGAAIAPAREAEAHYRREGIYVERARALLALAEALARAGDPAQARVLVDECDALASARGLAPIAAAAAVVRAHVADRTGALRDYVESLGRLGERVDALGDRVAAALGRVGLVAVGAGRSALDARVARLGLDRGAERVQATDTATFLLSHDEPPPYDSRLTIVLDRQLVRAGDVEVPMTHQQIALLEFLCISGGASLEELYLGVFGGRQYAASRHRSTVYVAIARLRAALEPVVGADAIIERADAGYRIARPLRASVVCALADLPARSGLAGRLAETPLSARTGSGQAPPESGPRPREMLRTVRSRTGAS